MITFVFNETIVVHEELQDLDLKTATLGPKRNLESKTGQASAFLERFLRFELIRGADDSAPVSDFAFSV